MRIWLVKAGEALPNEETGDRLRRMGLLAAELAKRGHKVTWFNSTFYHARKLQRYHKDTLLPIAKNYKIILIKANGYQSNISLCRLLHHMITAHKFRSIARKGKKPDLILCSMPTIELAEAAVKYGRKNKIPTVVDIRDLWPDIYREMLPRKIRFLIQPYVMYCRRRLKKLLAEASAITSITSGFLEWGLAYAGRKASSYDRVFHMGYKAYTEDVSNIDAKGKCIWVYPSEADFKEWGVYSPSPDDFIVCFFGTIGRQFNYEPLIQAAELLRKDKGIKLLICGAGEYLTKLKEQSCHLENIIYTGWINEKQIRLFLRMAAVGLAPYRESKNFTINIPNKFAEYLSASMPVLLGIDGEMGKMAEQYGCGYVYRTGEELAAYILKLKVNPDLRKSMSINAGRLFKECFDAEKVYSDMVTYLEEIVTGSSAGVNNSDTKISNGCAGV